MTDETRTMTQKLLSFQNSQWLNKIGYKVYSTNLGYAIKDFKLPEGKNAHTGMLVDRRDCFQNTDMTENTIPAVTADDALFFIQRNTPGDIVFDKTGQSLMVARFVIGDSVIEYESRQRRTEEQILEDMFSDKEFRSIVEFYINGGKCYTLGR